MIRRFALPLTLLAALGAVACDGSTDTDRITALQFRADTLRAVEGEALMLAAEASDQDGNSLSGGRVTWTQRALPFPTHALSAAPDLSGDGLLTPRGMAAVMVTATAGDVTDSVVVLTEPRVDSVTFNIRVPNLEVSPATALGVQATASRGANGVTETSPVPMRYVSSDPAVVQIQETRDWDRYVFLYRMVAVAPGTATVTASYGGASKSVRVTVRQVPTPAMNSCVIAADGEAWCRGANGRGGLGVKTGWQCGMARFCTQQRSEGAVRVATELKFASVSSSGDHSCALTPGGTAYCWGSNEHGELGATAADPDCEVGPGNTSTSFRRTLCSFSPVAVQGGLTFKTLELSRAVSCGVAMDDRRYCWGYGYGSTPKPQ